ncbi:MAG: hypothetical protein EA425_00100, partial [Puniceicoccaceae bacterium]
MTPESAADTPPPVLELEPAMFWEMYFHDRLIELTRDQRGNYRGLALDHGEEGEKWIGTEFSFSLDRERLEAETPWHDPRFQLGAAESVGHGLASWLSAPAYREDSFEVRSSIHLALRLVRDADPAPGSLVLPELTRDALKQHDKGQWGLDRLVARLISLKDGRDESIAVLVEA